MSWLLVILFILVLSVIMLGCFLVSIFIRYFNYKVGIILFIVKYWFNVLWEIFFNCFLGCRLVDLLCKMLVVIIVILMVILWVFNVFIKENICVLEYFVRVCIFIEFFYGGELMVCWEMVIICFLVCDSVDINVLLMLLDVLIINRLFFIWFFGNIFSILLFFVG